MNDSLERKIVQETSKISWHGLQRFFARGEVFVADSDLDLVEVATQIANDNKQIAESWLTSGKLAAVSDQQAKQWYEDNRMLWAVVVKPWVIVQVSDNKN